jgi:hypothetical protein
MAFALAWGAFPLLTAYVAQAGRVGAAGLIGAVAAYALSYAQRSLSTPARLIRRRVHRVEGSLTLEDGTIQVLDAETILAPLERALRAMSWATIALAAAFAIARLT